MKKAATIFAILLGIGLFAPQQAAHAQTQSPQATKVQVTTVHDALKLTFQVKPNTKYSLKDLNNQPLASGKAKKKTVTLKKLHATSTRLVLKTTSRQRTSKKVITVPSTYPIPHSAMTSKPVAIGRKVAYYGHNKQLLFTIKSTYLPNMPENKTGISLTFHNNHYAIPLSFSPSYFTASANNQKVAIETPSNLPVINTSEEKTINLILDVPKGKAADGVLVFSNADLTLPINFFF